jgi:hypothetical protein
MIDRPSTVGAIPGSTRSRHKERIAHYRFCDLLAPSSPDFHSSAPDAMGFEPMQFGRPDRTILKPHLRNTF